MIFVGGVLAMDASGAFAVCEFCGMRYPKERLQAKIREIRIAGEVQARQTGTTSDVQQWKVLLKKYMDALDYSAAMPVCRKILEAAPTDEEANKAYDALQQLQYMDIRNGVLVKYTGKASKVVIPEGVTEIGEGAFKKTSVSEVKIPNSVTKIGNSAFANTTLAKIEIPNSVTAIGGYAFAYTPLG